MVDVHPVVGRVIKRCLVEQNWLEMMFFAMLSVLARLA